MSTKIKLTVVDRAAAIESKVMTSIAQARVALNWSEADLAKAAGLTKAAVKAMAAGQGPVQPLLAAMNLLRLELSALVDGDYLAQRLISTRVSKGLSVDNIAMKTKLPIAAIGDLEDGAGELADLFLVLAIIAPRVGCLKKRGWGKRDNIDSDTRVTSPEILEAIQMSFGDIDVDPCGNEMSPVVAADRIMLSDGRDGLLEQWKGRLVFVNPPFSKQLDWLERARDQWAKGNAQTVLCLVPVKTCNNFFHSSLYSEADFFMIKGRPRFGDVNGKWEATKFSLMFVIFGATYRQKMLLANLIEGKWASFFDLAPLTLTRMPTATCVRPGIDYSCVSSLARWKPQCGPVAQPS